MASGILVLISLVSALPSCLGQAGGVYDFGGETSGQKRGDWSPGDWVAFVLLVMIIAAGLALTIGLCYYVNKRQTRISHSGSNPYNAKV